MSYEAEQRIWYDGWREPPTTFYGFFLSYKDWDMLITPFTSKGDRNDAWTAPGHWGLSEEDAFNVGALISAYVESWNEDYWQAAFDIASEYEGFNSVIFDRYVQGMEDDVDDTSN